MTRLALLCCALAQTAPGADVTVRVLELFHPKQLSLAAPPGARIVVQTDAAEHALEGAASAGVALAGERVLLHLGFRPLPSSRIRVNGPVTVRVGDAIERTFEGRLTIEPHEAELRLVTQLPIEEAVAAIVAAEAGSQAPAEAQRAQAIATRSFLLASNSRHSGYDFCDTTHCQHFTAAAPASRKAAESTAGLALRYRGEAIEALSTRRCGGTTKTLAEIGLSGESYPYFPVACEPCRREPIRWEKKLLKEQAAGLLSNPGFESARLEVVRKLGWSAVPSNAYTIRLDGDRAVLTGRGEGHGAGLCQFAAAQLAREGWDAARILERYFVNAAIAKR